jgi:hypothetical protein
VTRRVRSASQGSHKAVFLHLAGRDHGKLGLLHVGPGSDELLDLGGGQEFATDSVGQLDLVLADAGAPADTSADTLLPTRLAQPMLGRQGLPTGLGHCLAWLR